MQQFETSGDAAVVVDDTYFPIVIATWFGPPNERLINYYVEWQTKQLRRAATDATRVATVIDALDGVRPPATIRKVLTEHSETMLKDF